MNNYGYTKILFYLFPTETIREEKPKLKDKIWSHISMVLFFSGLVFLIFQMSNIENIIEESNFWKNFGFLGFSFSLICLFFLYKFQPSVFSESGRRYSVIFGFVLGLTALTISTSSFLNKKKLKKKPYNLNLLLAVKVLVEKRISHIGFLLK